LSNQVQDKNEYYTLFGIWTIVRDKLNDKTGTRISYERFSKIVRTYLDVVLHRVIYKHQEVELYSRMGTLFGTKILCTEFNPYSNRFSKDKKVNLNVMEDDGYFYFIAWRFPEWFSMYRFKTVRKWKGLIYGNVKAGSDYAELCP
jgi:hypothetical protein